MKLQPIRTETIKDQIYHVLRQEIIEGTLPPGHKIVEQAVADQLNVSRSPVREAIKQLVGDGLLTYVPNCGAFVKQPSAREVLDSFDMRILLEEYAINHIDNTLRERSRKQLLRLRKKTESLSDATSITEYLTVDRDIHTLIVQMCGNNVAADFYERIWGQIAASRTISLMSPERLRLSFQEHAAIIDCILEERDEEACAILRTHLQEARNTVTFYLGDTLARSLCT